MKKPYPSPYDMSDITYINTEPKIDYVKIKSIEDKIDDINKKLDQILEALKDFEKSK
jgi:hypothetical protein